MTNEETLVAVAGMLDANKASFDKYVADIKEDFNRAAANITAHVQLTDERADIRANIAESDTQARENRYETAADKRHEDLKRHITYGHRMLAMATLMTHYGTVGIAHDLLGLIEERIDSV